QVIGLSDVLGLGDATYNKDHSWPSTAQVALQQGEIAARNVMALRASSPLQPFEFKDFGEMLSLGVGEASLTGMGFTLAGPLAFQIRRGAYLTKLPGLSLGLRSGGAWLLGH
ncbi:MAG: NAD(P)/FAD-dependent oxidoreductase, partial [Cyanobacteriota bacterium]|nr:NAD(P)/FAD-dependent oxidoreductase [Cyanobacteriota bacterium]